MELNSQISLLEQAYNGVTENPTRENLDRLFSEICNYKNLDKSRVHQSIFNPTNSLDIKKYIASSLLRIFHDCKNLIWKDKDLRLKVFSLLDDVYSENLYKLLKINKSDDNHKKTPALESLSSELESEFIQILESITSLETSLKIRTRYMAAINRASYSTLIENQIYDKSLLTKERLSEFFNSLESYTQANRIEKLSTYNHLHEVYTCYKEDLKKNQENKYSIHAIKNIIFKIFEKAERDYNNSDLHKSANIEVNAGNRKYPLDIENKDFNIKIFIENKGPGLALHTTLNLLEWGDSLEIKSEEVSLGTIDVGRFEIQIGARTLRTTDEPNTVLGIICYQDHQNSPKELDFEIEITPQRGAIDWDKIKYEQPYSLESVDTESDLIGRKDLLENIYSKLTLKKGESSIIHGQKRVGKTSLAKTIQSRLDKTPDTISIFIETGSLDKSSPGSFIRTLGEKIVRKIKSKLNNYNLESPRFNDSLQPLVSFIEDIIDSIERIRIVIIIDEFDEIPSQIYPYTQLGDSFFHSLRSISGESGEGRVSIILIGGENIDTIMQTTDKLNKFDAFNVGYFNKSEYWSDFKELLTSPVKDIIDFTEDSILKLYEITEGNPFYTKFIAKTLYKKVCENRCSFITTDEMTSAIDETIRNLEAININHFWSDGIRVEDQEKKDIIETQRRRFLISLSEKLRNNGEVSKKELIDDPLISDIPSKEILENFISRNIIIENNLKLRVKPKLFEKWLTEKGINILRSSFSDEDALNAYHSHEDELYIKDSEISDLWNSWEQYRGREISKVDIRAWLSQFENNSERRAAFKLLQNLNFYGETKTREKLTIIHRMVTKETVHYHKKGERVRKDILLSCFGEESKSGPSYLRMYASENSISAHNVKKIHELKKTVESDESLSAIVFIDDIVATGQTMIDNINELNRSLGDLLGERDILIVIGIICGTSEAMEKIEETISKTKLNIRLKVCDILTEENRVFSNMSRIFDSQTEKQFALKVARKYGSMLQQRHPLGYNDSQLLVVFKDNCPNNTLPILWSSSNKSEWTPLFKRN